MITYNNSDVRVLLIQLANRITSNLKLKAKIKLGMLDGLSGQLLFLLLTEEHFPGTVGHKVLQNQLEHLQSGLITQHNINLGSGLTGIGLTFELMQKILGSDEDINEQIDLAVLERLEQQPWQGDYELLQGVTGLVHYAIQRKGYPTGKQLLDKCLDELFMLGQNIEANTIIWPTDEKSIFKLNPDTHPEINLGLAHGNFGTLAVLIKAYRLQQHTNLKEIIYKLSCYLLKQGKFSEKSSYFGYTNGDGKESRLGWCYGDLSNSLVLWHAGKALNDDEIMATAKKMALLAAKRKIENSSVDDMGLCHGASGNAVIFQSLYKAMNEKPLLDASNYWYSVLLNAFNSEKGLEALWRYNPPKKRYEESFGLLEGYAGIGLSLLSLLELDSSWKSLLLMD